MANEQSGVKFFVIYTILALLTQHTSAKDEDNPMGEILSTLMMEAMRSQGGASVIGSMLQGFMQDGGVKANNGGNAGELVSSILQTMMKGGGDEEGQQGGGIDPAVIMGMLSSVGKVMSATDNNNVDENNNEADSQRPTKVKQVDQKKGKQKGMSVDWETFMGMLGNIASLMQGQNTEDGMGALMKLFAVIMNSVSGQHNTHTTIPHHTHEPFLPPILENLHEYWDHFSNSEFGKLLKETSGIGELIKHFTNKKGEFETDKVFESLENNSFRRRWVKSGANFIAQWLKHIVDPKAQAQFKSTLQVLVNSFLQTQGYPKSALIDFNKPGESISAFADTVFKKHFDLDINSAAYVKPAVSYITVLIGLGQMKADGIGLTTLSTSQIEGKLSETIDTQVIEPLVRVNRAYRYGVKRTQCAKYVLCSINAKNDGQGLKPGVTKLASLGASWFISDHTQSSFWDMYQAVVDDKCLRYDAGCQDFHEEDTKATTEYYHNEL